MGKGLLIVSLLLNLLLIAALGGFIQTFGGPKYFLFRLTNSGADGVSEGRDGMFASLPKRERAIVMLGDSLIQNGEWAELLNNPRVVNRGISGQWSEVLYSRMEHVIETQPEKVFLMTGINDLRGRSVEEVAQTVQKIVGRLNQDSAHTRVFVHSILPVNNTIKETGRTNADIRALNAHLAKVCESSTCQYLDIHSHFAGDAGHLKEHFSHDGVHLNGEGYQQWAQLIEPFVQQTLDVKPTSF